MKKLLGVLGGMGPQASASFYETILKNTKAEKDQEHIDIIIYNHASIPDRTEAIDSGNLNLISNILLNDIKKLEYFGADYIVVTCNTSHYFLDKISNNFNSKFLSIVDETVNYITSRNWDNIGLLATNGTINKKIYENKLDKNGISVILPNSDIQSMVMNLIYNNIKKGIPVDINEFNYITEHLKKKGATRIILGCTELSLYGEKIGLSDFFINPQVILARKCISLCGGELI